MKFKEISTKAKIFLAIVLLLSIVNINNNLSDLKITSLINSIIGLIGLIVIFYNKRIGLGLLKFWTFSQVVVFAPIWETGQVITFNLGFTLVLKSGTNIEIGVNLIGLLIGAIYYFLYKSAIIDDTIRLKPIRKESLLNNFMPSDFKIQKEILISGKQWILLKEEQKDIYGIISNQDTSKFRISKNIQYNYKVIDNPDNIEIIDVTTLKGGFVKII